MFVQKLLRHGDGRRHEVLVASEHAFPVFSTICVADAQSLDIRQQ